MALQYRLHEPEDLPALRALWEAETGWGSITDTMWRRYVEEHPAGGSAIVVATDRDSREIVGEFVFVPSLVWVQGREVRAFRPAAPIVSKRARGAFANPMHHPAVAMYNYAAKALRERGDGVIYMVPDPRWVRFLKMFPMLAAGTFPLWQVPVPLDAPLALGDGHAAAPIAPDDPRVDALWASTREQYRCAVVRDARALGWRLGGGEYDVVGIERAGELVGLSASRAKGDRQWLICDVMARDEGALHAALAAAVNLGHARALADGDGPGAVRKATVLVTPRMEPVARALGFVRDAYDFPLMVHILDASLSKADLAPAHWYVSATD
jgi:hypothetical protein